MKVLDQATSLRFRCTQKDSEVLHSRLVGDSHHVRELGDVLAELQAVDLLLAGVLDVPS
jgi:hypothetical protein